MTTIGRLCVLAASMLPSTAIADTKETLHELGTSVTVGGGFVQFVRAEPRDYATEGVGWEARVALGTKTGLAFELGYLGTLHAVDIAGVDTTATLLGTNIDAVLRINFRSGRFQPFALGGGGWGRYSLRDTATNTSTMGNVDNIAIFPFGVGVAFNERGFVIDARAIYRVTSNVQMLPGIQPSLDSWSATLGVGFAY